MSKTTHIIEHDVHTIIEEESPGEVRARKGKRTRLFIALTATVAVLGSGYYAYDVLIASQHVETDNAYVGANVAQVTPLVGGPVREVLVDDTQPVRRGEILVRLDDTDAKIALARAEAELASAVRRVRGLVATDSVLGAQIAARVADQTSVEAQLTAARGDLDKARIDLQRREALAASGSVSGDELTVARNAQHTALARVKAAEAARAQALANRTAAIGSRDANKALIDNSTIDANPEVLVARAARDQAHVDLERMILRAPIDGVISRRQVQIGQRVQPGQALMVVVPIQGAYVDANFKEVQLAKVRPGQPVRLTSDLYGGKVEYHGRVVGFSGGTGAAFAVVPAQNATGNWIKVVQRLPVRIKLDPKQLGEHPLRVGLSMSADIDISN
ncbi:membrane fusion protein (multidrug efflux system) [Sphingobium wenxiniae]|uniref:Membrane fusion protein (Multidrug efflux system) n=1 Tax=Sphingobium wenxiniae (strain DSM 21828 / CGMCC 1.7748 / JZ-1) TaxID=595605 RepID=A0A562K456_SPHWJ|nr:HlyD family efflux transporter periplasmic adaptor subunit [Sphingobium wenxiniae]MBB6193747.1 membrane fusion protein (multidrug efflux system) [Sphingobium wenxiniae]MDF0544676.1 efflux RND transporter periplasmic adaptor subunit [Sphingobium arseniciresistens]TWH90231.1 membrane fusion protein (multidrug efflux system) [Sphingobium wenxiniae]